jgi:hypothetical protein
VQVLTIDTEHLPGTVAVVEVDDCTPDVERLVAVLGSVGDPFADHARRHAEDLAGDDGWVVSGPWALTTDAYVAPVVSATGCSVMVPDPNMASGQAPCGLTAPHEHHMGDGKPYAVEATPRRAPGSAAPPRRAPGSEAAYGR